MVRINLYDQQRNLVVAGVKLQMPGCD